MENEKNLLKKMKTESKEMLTMIKKGIEKMEDVKNLAITKGKIEKIVDFLQELEIDPIPWGL